MATAESVKIKIQALINKGNTVTGKDSADLSSVVDELIEGYSEVLVDVDALPTENIDQGKIYRVKKDGSAELYVVGEGMSYPFAELMRLEGIECQTNYYVVNELPETMEPSAVDFTVFNFYVLESTGVCYFYPEAEGKVYTVGTYMFDGAFPDKGWAEDVGNIDEAGFYAVKSAGETTYGIPDEADNKIVYEHTSATGWKELGAADGKPITVTTSEEMDAVLANATEADIGKFYLYTGGESDKYENDAVYKIEQE